MKAKVINDYGLPTIFAVDGAEYIGKDEFWQRRCAASDGYAIIVNIHQNEDSRGIMCLCGNKTMIVLVSDDTVTEAEAVRMHQNLSELLRQRGYVNLCIGEEDCILNDRWKVVLA